MQRAAFRVQWLALLGGAVFLWWILFHHQFQYQYVDSVSNRMNYYHQQGRDFLLGARYKF